MSTFVFKHKYTTKFVKLETHDSSDPSKGCSLVMNDGDIDDNMHFVFDVIDGVWGYIKHVKTGKYVHPFQGQLKPEIGTKLILDEGFHAACLFALDEVKNEIIHKSGKRFCPQSPPSVPADDTKVLLYEECNDNMKFLFVSPSNPKEEVMVYGKPKFDGSWRLVSAFINATAEGEHTLNYKIGVYQGGIQQYYPEISEKNPHPQPIQMEMYNRHAGRMNMKFKWELPELAESFIQSTSSSTILMSSMLLKTSQMTWEYECGASRKFKVNAGESVVTWQYVFEGEQHGHKTYFYTNLLAETKSVDEVPRDCVDKTKIYVL